MNLWVPDSDAMEASGARLAEFCLGGELISLAGELGTGKTTLVRGFMRACGYKGPVKSPTFTLVEPYSLAKLTIYHFDFYRLTDPQEGEFLGLRDYFDGSSVCLVEWPEKAYGLLPKADLSLRLDYQGPGRDVSIQYLTEAGARLAAGLNDNTLL